MKKIKSIFTDKASILLRRILQDPGKKWIIRDFVKEGISPGWVSEILTEMLKEGYIERISKGPLSYSVLKHPDKLIADWANWYKFKYNTVFSFFSPIKDIEGKIIRHFRNNNIPYALTLFSGAKKIAPYVNDPRIHIYIPDLSILGDLIKFRETFNLMELKESGTIHFVIPYYKNSVFKYIRHYSGAAVASPLQLYLDLYTFSPRGKEQAEYLLNFLRRNGYELA